MIRDSAFQHFGEVIAHQKFLLGTQRERIGRGQHSREFTGEHFGAVSSRRKNQNGTQIVGERFGDEARPVTANLVRHMKIQIVGIDFFERDGSLFMSN